MRGLLVLSGPIGVGKSKFAESLTQRFGLIRVSTRAHIQKVTGCAATREALQVAGDDLDKQTIGKWVVAPVEEAAAGQSEDALLLLDSARIAEQIAALKERFHDVFHVHLTAELDVLERRYEGRERELKEYATYAEARKHGTEAQVETLAERADLVLNTDHTDPHTLADTAMAYWEKAAIAKVEPLVDVIVGGQYGSEGKGNICAHIAKRYNALVRVGGPNAGHQVVEPRYNYVQLPSGTGSNDDAAIMIGAGATLWLPQVMKEIIDRKLDPERLSIDPQAIVIDDEDRRVESAGLASISSTAQGVGAASARKILNRGEKPIFGPSVMLARHVKQLAPYVREVRGLLDGLYREGKPVLLEGTQGTALSIHHGLYPHVTSRETSAAGCLADAGISPKRVRRVIMVVRTFPIRVGGASGWMGREISFEDVARLSGVELHEIIATEKGSVSGRQRRIAHFDWAQLRRAVEINGATEIALTFVDYLGVENRSANSFADLNQKAKDFIAKVEAVAGVPVTYVSKAFAPGGVLEKEGTAA